MFKLTLFSMFGISIRISSLIVQTFRSNCISQTYLYNKIIQIDKRRMICDHYFIFAFDSCILIFII